MKLLSELHWDHPLQLRVRMLTMLVLVCMLLRKLYRKLGRQ